MYVKVRYMLITGILIEVRETIRGREPGRNTNYSKAAKDRTNIISGLSYHH